MNVATLAVGMFATNCYLASCPETAEAVVIDPGAEGKRIIEKVKTLELKIKYIINTHAHIDHIGANGKLKAEFAVPLLLCEKDLELYNNPGFGLGLILRKQPGPDRFIVDGDKITFGTISLDVVETPGHTAGGISLVNELEVFCGDTLFAGSVGRTDLPGGSHGTLIKSIREKLLVLEPETVVYPGHGPSTSIGAEAASNPFVNAKML